MYHLHVNHLATCFIGHGVSVTNVQLSVTRDLENPSGTNFFAPVVENVTVTGDVDKTIEWDATDRNADDVLYYEVLM
ncbi:MAG: hypothetical protein ACOC3C_01380, partial [Candidatus Thorarchaeota archaeon]